MFTVKKIYDEANKIYLANAKNRGIVTEELVKVIKRIPSGEIFTPENKVSVGKIVRHKFFVPFESRYDFAGGLVSPFISSFILYSALEPTTACLLVGAVIGVAAFAVKGLVEQATSPESAQASFAMSSTLLKLTLALAVITTLSPILDVCSLMSRSAVSLAGCKSDATPEDFYENSIFHIV